MDVIKRKVIKIFNSGIIKKTQFALLRFLGNITNSLYFSDPSDRLLSHVSAEPDSCQTRQRPRVSVCTAQLLKMIRTEHQKSLVWREKREA